MPFAQARPVRQHTCPLAPQQVAFSQVPTAQAALLATHPPLVSQQPICPGTPLQRLFAQQASPAAPQAWHAPAAQTSFTPQVVPARRQVFPMQQFPPVHWFAAQHISADAPQAVHRPLRQRLPAVLQLVSLATQALLAGSQQAPAPVQAGPVRQQAAAVAPQVEQRP